MTGQIRAESAGSGSGAGRTALITGASSGIGKELTALFAQDGYNVVLVSRRTAVLEAMAQDLAARHGITALVLTEDLRLDDAPSDIYNTLAAQSVTIDILVNNAGVGVFGEFHETDAEADLDILRVNLQAAVHLTKVFLPGMVSRRAGKILNLSSTAAFQPGPLMSVYYASKAFLFSWSEALRDELRGTGVTVTVLCPGPTPTGFQERAGIGHLRIQRGAVLPLTSAERVARDGYRGLMAGKQYVIPGAVNSIAARAARLVSPALAARVVHALHRP
jgi:short-subunit dehydrogenase